MSAPIDDLLYGGDDSGDEDDMNVAAVPMPAFGSAPLLPAGAAPLGTPLTATGASAPPGAKPLVGVLSAPVSAPASIVGSVPLGSVGIGVKPATAAPLATAPAAAVVGVTAIRAPPLVTTVSAAPKQAPGSGQQMFQQMFALLKQMLSPEQYATFYTEMRNGNGNDIKSIVDIIKRIAGDAMFSSLIQKLDLTRPFPTTSATAATPVTATVKSEPSAAVTTAGTAVARPGAPLRMASSTAATTPVVATTTTTAPTLVGATPATAAALPRAGSPGLTAKTPPPATGQRPNLVQAAKSPSAVTPASSNGAAAAPAATVKPEPKTSAAAAATTSATSVTTSTPSASSTTASPSTAAASKNEQQLEKIEFAKKLLSHAATCTLTPGVCQVTKCDDVRRVFKHSVSCGGARSCSHCEQLKGLVKYHARECATGASEHCTIPFCDGLRRAYLTAAATLAAKSKASSAATGSAASKLGVTSDDDDDNTPLSSAVSKAKKNSAKAKSPKASPTVRATTASPAPTTAAAKKKAAAAAAAAAAATPATTSKPATPATTAATATTAASSASTTTTATTAASAAKPAPAKAAVTANMTVEYGRLLQLILHVQKCTASTCPVGDECTEAKALLREINSPNAPPRAKTYKQVYSHHKVCLAKNNTGNCPMCKIGLRPILPADEAAPATSPALQSSSSSSATTNPSGAASNTTTVTSPSIGASGKRSNSTVTPSPRSPSKKQRTSGGGNSRVKAAPTLPDPAQSTAASAEQSGHDLTQASVADIRKEADVLTHTSIDLSAERRTMMDGAGRRRNGISGTSGAGTGAGSSTEHLACKKEEWIEKDLFNSATLRREMTALARRGGVTLGAHTHDVLSYALHEYLKQVVEEMVAVSKQRGDIDAQAFEAYQKSENTDDRDGDVASGGGSKVVEVTSTDILRVSCEDAFTRTRAQDLALRAQLLDDAKREEAAEKERAKKRKKVDRSKLQQEEKDEAEMDMDELAVKDLKDRLLQEDKDGVVRIDGRVNESISSKFARRLDHQVAIEDADYWLENQKPYIPTKLFVRAEAARIVTKSLL